MKLKPTGFVAICQCGKTVGALDSVRTDPKDAGKFLSQWLSDGCTVQPMFTGTWVAEIKGYPENRVGTGQMNNIHKTEFRVERNNDV